ncbi:MAG: SDR family NAD(P)-dependent oxidoreductase [Candidatus Micrarchaeia archaeon]
MFEGSRQSAFKGKKVIVTGGAGFIGSHIVDELLARDAEVKVIDNMRSGQPKVVEQQKKNKKYSISKADITDLAAMKSELKGYDFVFHLAANADIRGGITNTKIDLEQNTLGTYNVIEAVRVNGIKDFCFTSSAAVYGNPSKIPTPEDIQLVQNSLYGASKLAGESLAQAFAEYYGIRNYIYRFVSIIGERYPHGCVIDFYRKLRKNPKELEILGDGKQKKSFLYVGDCVKGVFAGIEGAKRNGGSDAKSLTNLYNLGNDYTIEINRVADIIIEEMGLNGAKKTYTGGEVGWIGDQKIVHLSTDKIRSLGWMPEVKIEDGIRRTVRYLMENEK